MGTLGLKRGPFFPDYHPSEKAMLNMYGKKAIVNLRRTQEFFDRLNTTKESKDG